MKAFLRRLWCALLAHDGPLEVEYGRVLTFVGFRCPRCRAQWFVAFED